MLNHVPLALTLLIPWQLGIAVRKCSGFGFLFLCWFFLTHWACAVPSGFEHSGVFPRLAVSGGQAGYFCQVAPPDLTLT